MLSSKLVSESIGVRVFEHCNHVLLIINDDLHVEAYKFVIISHATVGSRTQTIVLSVALSGFLRVESATNLKVLGRKTGFVDSQTVHGIEGARV